MQQVFVDDCLSRGRTYEWYTRFRNGRDINDDPHVEIRDYTKDHW